MVEPVNRDEASVGQLLRSSWRFTRGRRWSVALAAALALCLFAMTAVLPLLTGRLLDTALSHANASAQAKRFVSEWLAIQDAARQVLASDEGAGLDAASVATGARAATAQAIAARPDEYLDALFPNGLSYDVSGALGRRIRSQFDEGGAPWIDRVKAAMQDGVLERGEVATLLRTIGNRTPQESADAFSFVVANLSLEDFATEQRDHWRRDQFVRDLLLLGGLIAAVAVLRMATLRISLRLTLDGARQLQDDIFGRVHDTTVVESGTLGRPSMVSRCTSYVERVQSALTQLMTRGVPAAANLALSTGILLWIDAATGILMCGLLLIFEVVRRAVSPRWSRAVRRKLDDNTRLSEVADDAISHIGPIRRAGAEGVQRRQFARRADEVRSSTVRIDTISEGFDFAAFALGQVGVLLSVAIIGFARDGISLGQATASLLYVRAMSDAIGALPAVVVSLQEAAPYMRRLDRVLGFPLRRTGSGHTEAPGADDRSLVLETVSYSPADGSHGCSEVEMIVLPGTWWVVAAQQRAARDAVLVIAAGLDQPDEGTVRVGGTDLSLLDLASVRAEVACVDAAPYVADASVLDNLRLARPEATEHEVWTAARLTSFGDWIDTLPSGLDTVVGRLGHHVPKSERINMAITRALVSAARVVVIDDPTEHLDAEAAAECWRTMRRLFTDRSVLVGTARLDLIAADDHVVVLHDGKVAEHGTVDHLLRHGVHWPALWSRHSGGVDAVATLREFPSLARLPDSVLQRSGQRFVTETFEAGEVVFRRGELADRLFVIARGCIELWDDERRIATLHDGDHFGEFDPLLDAVSDSRRSLTARAAATTTLSSLHRGALTGGAAQVLEGSAHQRSVYRHLARNGALTEAEICGDLPDIDVTAVLDELLVGGSVTRSVADGLTIWRIAGEARRAGRQSSQLLERLEQAE